MIFNKNKLIILSLAIILLVSSHATQAFSANGNIWASDQASVSPYTNNLWSSVDGGITWISETTNLPWSPRHAYKMVARYY